MIKYEMNDEKYICEIPKGYSVVSERPYIDKRNRPHIRMLNEHGKERKIRMSNVRYVK